jgi:tetratricopeptide (TPR) repeat protein
VRLDFDRARAAFDEALALYRSLADQVGELRALNGLGQFLLETGEYDRAEEVFAERKRLAADLGDGSALAVSEFCLGCIAMELGELDTAERRFDRSRAAFREQGNARLSAMVLAKLAELAERTRDLDGADRLLDRCEAAAGRLGDGRLTAHARRIRGGIALARGEYARALDLHREVLGREREAGSRRIVIAAAEGIACALAGLGLSEGALRLAGSASALRDALRWPLTPSERYAIDPLLALATEALGVEAAGAAFRDGRDWDFEEAIAAVLTKP